MFKTDNPDELAVSGLQGATDGGRSRLAPGSFHRDWDAPALTTWKDAVLELLAKMKTHPERTPQQISCEFIPFPDHGGGGRYDLWQNNIACARWLQEEWQHR